MIFRFPRSWFNKAADLERGCNVVAGPRRIPPSASVPFPTSVDQAVLYGILGLEYLKQNAPEKLKPRRYQVVRRGSPCDLTQISYPLEEAVPLLIGWAKRGFDMTLVEA